MKIFAVLASLSPTLMVSELDVLVIELAEVPNNSFKALPVPVTVIVLTSLSSIEPLLLSSLFGSWKINRPERFPEVIDANGVPSPAPEILEFMSSIRAVDVVYCDKSKS